MYYVTFFSRPLPFPIIYGRILDKRILKKTVKFSTVQIFAQPYTPKPKIKLHNRFSSRKVPLKKLTSALGLKCIPIIMGTAESRNVDYNFRK